ncbi:hypothetical protein N7490_002219 [Penicillium lividum]|nr:hypothetical protein N7490_002219 [Penicillium lividum]
MQFKLSNLFGLLAVAGTALSIDVATSIDGYSALAKDVGKTASSITLVNGFETGQKLIKGYKSLIDSETNGYDESEDSQALATTQQQAACNSFVSCASVLTSTINTTVDKHGILEVFSSAYPVLELLRSLEGITDQIAYTLLSDLASSCGDGVKESKTSLDKVFTKAVDTFTKGIV